MNRVLLLYGLLMFSTIQASEYVPPRQNLGMICPRVGRDCGFFIGAAYKPEHTIAATAGLLAFYELSGYGLRWAIPDRTDSSKLDIEHHFMRKSSEVTAQAGCTAITLLSTARIMGIEPCTGLLPCACAAVTTAAGMTGMYMTSRKNK